MTMRAASAFRSRIALNPSILCTAAAVDSPAEAFSGTPTPPSGNYPTKAGSRNVPWQPANFEAEQILPGLGRNMQQWQGDALPPFKHAITYDYLLIASDRETSKPCTYCMASVGTCSNGKVTFVRLSTKLTLLVYSIVLNSKTSLAEDTAWPRWEHAAVAR